ncbi:COX15/CtaA family protein [Raineya sp.]|jgi:cytochrome c oxidase assembly protein subunit 15
MRKNFVQFSWVTILAVYLLILVGGIVRSTGSGMGCPDWPKCFGKIVPPTDIRELPENYKEIYAQKRKEKNLRLVGFLKSIGMKDAAQRVQNDETIYIEEDFNVQKTWIEYLNRLLGVLIGLLIFVTFITSLSYLKTKPIVSILSFVALLLVGFQGWIGSIVVSTNLLEGMITLHMFLAVVQVLLMAYTVHLAQSSLQAAGSPNDFSVSNFTKFLLILNLVFSLGQVLLGTQVREQIDTFAREVANRSYWIEKLDIRFYIHRSYSLFLLALNVFLLYRLKKENTFSVIQKPYFLLLGVLIVSTITGAIMAYFAMPAFLQPIHLLLAVAMMGLEWEIWLRLKSKGKSSAQTTF